MNSNGSAIRLRVAWLLVVATSLVALKALVFFLSWYEDKDAEKFAI
jgi:hypothetical protein